MIFFYIPSSYAKVFGETKFQPWEIPRNGSKAKHGEKREEKKKRGLNYGNNNDQLHIANTTSGGALKLPGLLY